MSNKALELIAIDGDSGLAWLRHYKRKNDKCFPAF